MMEKFVFQELCLLDANNHILERREIENDDVIFLYFLNNFLNIFYSRIDLI